MNGYLRNDWRDATCEAVRAGFGHGLVLAAREHPQVVALSGDLMESVGFGEFQKEFGEPRCIEVGVAEQDLVTVASGLAAMGAIPFAARDPMRVLPCCIVGGALTGAISMAIGAKLMAPHGGLFVLLIPGAITPVLGYLVAIIAGTLVAGLSYAVLKRPEDEVVAKAA